MEQGDVALLTSSAGRKLLDSLPSYEERAALGLADRLRRQGHDPQLVAAALTQARLRARAAARWDGSMASWLLLTPEGGEQATRPSVAAERARRFAALAGDSDSTGDGAGAGPVADLGCGIGLDALALDRAGLAVEAFESDLLTAQVAAANVAAAPWGARITVHEVDVTRVARDAWTRYRAAFADPARRRGGRRLFRPDEWSPPLSWVLDLPIASLAVKVAPGLDHALVPPGAELAVLSDGGQVVEATIYRGALRQPDVTRSAILLPGRHVLTDRDVPEVAPPVRPVGRYLYEPDGAVVRAGLVGAVVAELDGWLLDPQIAYVSSDEPRRSRFAAAYQVRAVMPFSLKRLRDHLRTEQVGRVVLKKRGSAVDLDDLQRRLRLDRSQPEVRTVLLTRIGQEPIAVVADAGPTGPTGSGG